MNEPSPGLADSVDARARAVRIAAVTVVWFGGLAAGFVGMLAAAAHYGCGTHDSGLACERSGSVYGALIVVAAVAVVVAVTMLTFDRPVRRALVVCGIGFALLAVLFALGEMLLSTV